jgi:hypothetical protein
LVLDPDLPAWLPDLHLRGVRVGASTVDVHCWRDHGETRWDVALRQGEIEVQQRPWEPW